MKNNETGEFEMAVGSRQLLSGFFVVVLLMGVAFAMGYVVGQNTRSVKVETAVQPARAVSLPGPAAPAPLEPARELIPDRSAGATAAPVAVERSKEKRPPARTTQRETGKGAQAEPAPGSYWQVKALRQNDAEVMVQTLKDMGLPALLSPSPAKPALMRVLVGPYHDSETMGRVKTRLEKAGLPPIRNNLK